MDKDVMFRSAFNGTKTFSQQDIKTANATGFGAAADDYMERGIDLNEQLILNTPATFFFRMNSDAMINAGIDRGDVLIVDRSIKAANGKIVVVAFNGDLIVRRLVHTMNQYMLMPENTKCASIPLNEFTECNVWGVVTSVIHIFEKTLFKDMKRK